MLFNNPALAGQCDPAAGVPIPKALNPVVPSGMGALELCQYLSSLIRITQLQLLSWNKEKVLQLEENGRAEG